MTHLETELHMLKEDILEMMALIRSQISKGREALEKYDRGFAQEVVANEKRVNSFELKIDRDSENIIALFNPVAVDLRLVLATLKINTNLERIGDNAEGIARGVLDVEEKFDEKLLKDFRIMEMFDVSISMLDDVADAFKSEDTSIARRVFEKDEILDEINRACTETVIGFMKKSHEHPKHILNLLSMIRKLERVGDQTKNISEEIIFFIEAMVLKHKSKLEKRAPRKS